ncbi:hypothetical protein [Nonomuraea insulae]|uniref:Uncharacterized protein n=1 Tax=Nonomuraea insulae TaxID=1616787 RepID=A0ABW1CSS0_9ACTN
MTIPPETRPVPGPGASRLGLLAGRALPGPHTVPDASVWLLARLAWLPVFALALLVCCAAFHTRPGSR